MDTLSITGQFVVELSTIDSPASKSFSWLAASEAYTVSKVITSMSCFRFVSGHEHSRPTTVSSWEDRYYHSHVYRVSGIAWVDLDKSSTTFSALSSWRPRPSWRSCWPTWPSCPF